MAVKLHHSTELAEEILTSDSARQMYNYVSPIYGNSYVGLWMFQVIGLELDRMKGYFEEIPTQLNPATATWLLPLWEERYGITPEAEWTIEHRREAVISKRKFNAPITPVKLSDMLSSLAGVLVEVIENTGKNKFSVYVRDNIPAEKFTGAKEFTDEAKPAHLIYDIEIAARNDVDISTYIGMGAAIEKIYNVEVP